MLRLRRYQEQTRLHNVTIFKAKQDKDLLTVEYNRLLNIRPHAELTMLEVKKYQKAAYFQDTESKDLFEDTQSVDLEASRLLSAAQRIIDHLQSYGLNSAPHISIKRALAEARDILAFIKGRSYADVDIKARTELSYARQSLSAINELLFDRNQLIGHSKSLDDIETKVNDLLQYLNRAMDHTREAMLDNQRHHDIFVKAQSGCSSTQQMISESNEAFESDDSLLKQAKEINDRARLSFGQLRLLFDKVATQSSSLTDNEGRLASAIDQYVTGFVRPCQEHANVLVTAADKVLALFDRDRGLGAERTLEAANAYQRIIKTVLQAGRAAEEAFTLSINLVERIKKKNQDGYDLFAQADAGRVKSRDLRQEAEGLRRNSREMQVQMEELILRWQSYILLVNKRKDDVLVIERDLDRLQIVTVLAEDAVRHSEESLRQAISVHDDVSKVCDRISQDLWQRVREMQSFSPEELGNIPRKRKQNNITFLEVLFS